jgi:hypothetical protein
VGSSKEKEGRFTVDPRMEEILTRLLKRFGMAKIRRDSPADIQG